MTFCRATRSNPPGNALSTLDNRPLLCYIIPMTITKTSPLTGNINTMDIDVSEEQLAAWQGGVLIQRAMPHLTPDEREFLMTGYTPEDWEEIFGE